MAKDTIGNGSQIIEARLDEDELDLLLDCLIQGYGFKDFEQRGIEKLQNKVMSIKNFTKETTEDARSSSISLIAMNTDKETFNVFQDLTKSLRSVSELIMKVNKLNEIVYEVIVNKDFRKKGEVSMPRLKKIVESTLDMKNCLTYVLMQLPAILGVMAFFGYGIFDESEEDEKGKTE